MKVTRVRETPRTTKPYSDEQWAKLLAVGEAIESDIGRHDLRLTMGGEPTFVSIDDRDAPYSFVAHYLREGRLLAALAAGNPRDVARARRHLEAEKEVLA